MAPGRQYYHWSEFTSWYIALSLNINNFDLYQESSYTAKNCPRVDTQYSGDVFSELCHISCMFNIHKPLTCIIIVSHTTGNVLYTLSNFSHIGWDGLISCLTINSDTIKTVRISKQCDRTNVSFSERVLPSDYLNRKVDWAHIYSQ